MKVTAVLELSDEQVKAIERQLVGEQTIEEHLQCCYAGMVKSYEDSLAGARSFAAKRHVELGLTDAATADAMMQEVAEEEAARRKAADDATTTAAASIDG